MFFQSNLVRAKKKKKISLHLKQFSNYPNLNRLTETSIPNSVCSYNYTIQYTCRSTHIIVGNFSEQNKFLVRYFLVMLMDLYFTHQLYLYSKHHFFLCYFLLSYNIFFLRKNCLSMYSDLIFNHMYSSNSDGRVRMLSQDFQIIWEMLQKYLEW